MRIECHVFIATSIDGFIARPNGSIDWLEEYNTLLPPNEDCGYAQFYNATDCLILGRKTFEKVLSFPEWPFQTKPVFVFSKNKTSSNKALPESVHFVTETPKALLERLCNEGFKKAYLDGGELIQSFLRQQLVSTLTITRIPILLGQGRRLFGELNGDIKLQHLQSKTWSFGFVQDLYRVLPFSTSPHRNSELT